MPASRAETPAAMVRNVPAGALREEWHRAKVSLFGFTRSPTIAYPKKGTGPICPSGPSGASHKWGLSPFSDLRFAKQQAAILGKLTDVSATIVRVELGPRSYDIAVG